MAIPVFGGTVLGTVLNPPRGALVRTVSLSLGIATLLAGCSHNDSATARTIAARFIQQVNSSTCDEPSGLKQESDAENSSGWAAQWAQACIAATENLATGTTISQPTVTSSSPGEIGFDYQATAQYENTRHLSATLLLDFDGEGPGGDRATLRSISSATAMELGWDQPHLYRQADVDPAAEELAAQVERLLVDGQCGEVQTLLAPAADFTGAGLSVDDCVALTTTIGAALGTTEAEAATDPPFTGGSWSAGVYSTVDLFGGQEGEIDGIPRRTGESQFDYGDRVLDQIETTDILAEKWITDPRLTGDLSISVVLFEGTWYLLNIRYEGQAFAVEFD